MGFERSKEIVRLEIVNRDVKILQSLQTWFVNNTMHPAPEDASKSDAIRHCVRPMQCDCSSHRTPPDCQLFVFICLHKPLTVCSTDGTGAVTLPSISLKASFKIAYCESGELKFGNPKGESFAKGIIRSPLLRGTTLVITVGSKDEG